MQNYIYKLIVPALFSLLSLFLASGYAQAHFKLNANIRVMHVEHTAEGINFYLRLPTPYLLADKLGPVEQGKLPTAAPYTYNEMQDGQLLHYVDYQQVSADSSGLGEMVAQGHQVKTSAGILRPRLQQVRVHTTAMQPPFASLDEAKQSFLKVQQRPLGEIYVGDTVTDVQLFYPTEQAAFTYQLSSNLKPGLDEQQQTANLLLDHLDGNTQIYRARGLLDTPIEVDRSVLSAVWTFFIEGIKHILEGPDHVLFVVCLVIGALSTRLLIWQVTGFTAGHSITLISGFFGWVPSGAWFIPSIETAIALSIIFAAITALRSGKQQHSMVITTVIGLVHGLGFSFMLREILQIDSGNLWQSLLAFNLGVEAGQIAIVLLLWPVISVVRHYWPQQSPRLTWAIAISCIAVASLWAGERLISLGDALA